MFPQEMIAAVVSFGGAGLLIWWLRQENQRLIRVIETKNTQLAQKGEKIVDLYEQRNAERVDYTNTVRTIGAAVDSINRKICQSNNDG
jgi:hypothetical protein